MRPLRIAFLSPDCLATQCNGTTSYLTRITRALFLLGHVPEVFSVSHLTLGPYDLYGIRVEPVAKYEGRLTTWIGRYVRLTNNDGLATLLRSLQGALALAKALEARERERPFDFVHCIDEGLTGLFVRKGDSRPLVTFCQYDRKLWMRTEGERFTAADSLLAVLIRRGVRRASLAYAHSRFLQDHLLREYGIQSHVLRPPVFQERRAVTSVPRGLPGRYLIHFGLLGRRKGTDLVAAALPLVWRQEPELEMVWAGSMRSDPAPIMAHYRQEWGRFANRVSWLGSLEKPVLYAVLKEAVAAVLPSRADNLPNTVSESLMFGVPVIGFQGASLDEMVEPGVCGELVPDGNVGALADAMLRAWRGTSTWRRPPAILAAMEPRIAATNLLRLMGHNSAEAPAAAPRVDSVSASGRLRLLEFDPQVVRVGEGFNTQPDGRSVFSLRCEYAGPWTTVALDDEQLETTFGNPTWLTALAPTGLADHPGRHRIHLVDEFRGPSNELEFTVERAPLRQTAAG